MVWDDILRSQLLARRQRLEAAVMGGRQTAQLVSLLQEVDATLERIGTPLYGLCDGCQKPIEDERLMADPLVRTCLGCLTEAEQRALEEDLDLAARIQNGLLPKSRNYDGWEVSFHYAPAGPVSGDYCDLVSDPDEAGSLYFLLGDVSGKGVAASLLMAHLHAMFRSLIGTGLPVDRLLCQANRVFSESTIATHFATLVCGRAGAAGEVEISNAGHCPPLLIRDGEVTPIEATGLPIGLFANGQYSVERVRLAPGDGLLLYTDGLSEAQDASGSEYGAERLAGLVRAHSRQPPGQFIGACLEDLARFLAPHPATDDLTMMVLRRATATVAAAGA